MAQQDIKPVSTDVSQSPEPVSVDATDKSFDPPSPAVASNRAFKTYFGLGSVLGQSYDDIHQSISQGNEDQVRKQAASSLDVHNAVVRQQSIQDALNDPMNPASVEGLDKLLDPTSAQNRPIDPQTVIEKGYGHAAMSMLDTASVSMGSTPLDTAKDVLPDTVNRIKDAGADIASKRQLIETQVQDLQDKIKRQSWSSWGADLGLTFVPLYSQLREIGMSGILLGNTADAHATETLQMPFDQFKDQFLTEFNQIASHNPQVALQYASHMLGQSTSDKILNNVLSVLDISSVPGLGAAGKAIRDLAGARNAVTMAAQDIVKAAGAPEPTQAILFNAAGASSESGVKTAATNIIQDIQGTSDITKRALESLPSYLKTDDAEIRANPGRGGQEIANRIEASSVGSRNNFLEVIQNTARVERIPEVVASEDAMRAILKTIKGNYTGPSSAIRDVKYLGHEPISNTHWVETQLVREDGSLFESPEEAVNWGDSNGEVTERRTSTMREEANAYAARRLELLDPMIKDLQNEIEGVSLNDDIETLHRYQDLKDKLTGLETQKRDLETWQASHQVAPDVHIEGREGYPIKQEGLGYYISKVEPLNETMNVVRDNLLQGKDANLPDSWTKGALSFMDWLRTPEETMSKLENEQRKIATHGPSVLIEQADKTTKQIQALKGQDWKNWNRIVDAARHIEDPDTGKMGYFFKNPQDFEDHYMRINNSKLPSAAETEAYFSFKRMAEMNRGYTIISEFRNKSRLGVQQHSIYSFDGEGTKVPSGFFEGRIHDKFPRGEDGVFVPGDKLGEGKMYAANDPELKTKYEEKWQKGQLTALEVYDPERRPLSEYGKNPNIGHNGGPALENDGQRIRYVLTNKFDSKPLSWENQVERTGGGHFVYDYDHYIKQANVQWDKTTKSHWYEGDRTVMPIQNRRMGVDVAKHMDIVRELIRDGKMADAEAHNKQYLRIPWKDHQGWYNPTRNPKGELLPPRLSLNEPFYVVPKDKNIMDIDDTLNRRYTDPETLHNTLKDGTKRGSLARTSRVEYNRERDAYEMHTLNDLGTRGKPLYQYEPAKLVDPVPTLNRAVNRVINSMFIDDQKIASVERWMRMAEDKGALDVETMDSRRSPFFYFSEANTHYHKALDPIVKSNLEGTRYQINQFVGTPSKLDAQLHSIASKISDSIYENLGPKAAHIPMWLLPKVRDPVNVVRSYATHTKLGLFSIPQLFMQLSTGMNVNAIGGPRHVAAVGIATILHQISRVNKHPETLEYLDNLATKMQLPGMSHWKPGEFKEFSNLVSKVTGFQNVGTEHALLDATLANNIVKGNFRGFLDMGLAPFRFGAENTRVASMAMAYREFRDGPMEGRTASNAIANIFGERPANITRRGSVTGALSRADVASIINRAADLDHNMSRASNSPLHTGTLMSFLGQFQTYPIRLAELMMGKRLTWQEKARLFTVSSVLYGLPVGGIGLFGYPVADYLYNQAKQYGYTVGHDFLSTMIAEGLPATVGAWITGGGDVQKGTVFNFKRFGDKGFDPIGELSDTDPNLWKIFGGAAGGSMTDLWKYSSSFRWAMMSLIEDGGTEFPMTADDIWDVIGSQVVSFSALRRLDIAINTHKWMSKNNTYLGDASPGQAIFSTMLGTPDARIANIGSIEEAIKAHTANQNWARQGFMKEMNIHFQQLADKDYEEAKKSMIRANAYLTASDYPSADRGSLIGQAAKNNQSLLKKLDYDYYARHVPNELQPRLTETYKEILRMESKKGERP